MHKANLAEYYYRELTGDHLASGNASEEVVSIMNKRVKQLLDSEPEDPRTR